MRRSRVLVRECLVGARTGLASVRPCVLGGRSCEHQRVQVRECLVDARASTCECKCASAYEAVVCRFLERVVGTSSRARAFSFCCGGSSAGCTRAASKRECGRAQEPPKNTARKKPPLIDQRRFARQKFFSRFFFSARMRAYRHFYTSAIATFNNAGGA